MRDTLTKQIAQAGLENRIRLRGSRDDAEALSIMRSSDLCVMPLRSEGTPIALLEAGALGLPIVATRAGGNTELIEDEVNGLLVPVGDTEALTRALERILTDGALRSKLQTAARASAERFSVSTMIEKTNSYLHTLI